MLPALAQWITVALDRATGTAEARFRHTLRLLLNSYDLAEIVRSVLTDENRSSVARSSYCHPNGFTKLVLIPFQPGCVPFELRLHDWHTGPSMESEEARLARESIHDHGWDFASYVASGSLLFEEFEEADGGRLYSQFKYLRPGPAIEYFQEHVGTQALRCTRRGIHRHPEIYFFPRYRLHRTIPSCGTRTVSLMLQSPYRPRQARVYRDPGQAVPRKPPAQRALTESELLETIEGLLPHIASTTATGMRVCS